MSSDEAETAGAEPDEKKEDEGDKDDEEGEDKAKESKASLGTDKGSESDVSKKGEEEGGSKLGEEKSSALGKDEEEEGKSGGEEEGKDDDEKQSALSSSKAGNEEGGSELKVGEEGATKSEAESKSELGDDGKSEVGDAGKSAGEEEEGGKSLDDFSKYGADTTEDEDLGKIELPLSWGEEGDFSERESAAGGSFGVLKTDEFGAEEGEDEEGEDEEEEEGEEEQESSESEPPPPEEEESIELDIYEESTEEELEELDEDRKDEWKPGMKITQYKTVEEGEEEVEEEEQGDFISVPDLSGITSFSEDFLEFYHSFGYDCRKHYNLCIPDENTVIFASGNYIHFFDVPSKTLTFRRSARGGGIGHIVKNPKYPHIAVGEKGENPLIIIYDWPSMERVVILRAGTQKGYASLHYSPDGEYLCSQGKEEDYHLTVWRWKKGRILRQQKAYGQDVLNAMFSQYNASNLTTGGFAHIKFWKLARTFTGIKLMGSIGRFGKTEMCDIIGFVALPDEQVISGCEWGNMLIWDEGLVKAEVTRKGSVPCHDGYISHLLFDDVNSEIITVGTDGFVRAWDYKLIEKSDLTEQDNKIVLEALHTLEVGKDDNKSQLRYIQKRDDDSSHTNWFAQDANGGIWLIDLDQDHAEVPEKIFTCHAGGICSVACCPNDKYVATYGDDGRVIFYNYKTKKIVLSHKFAAGGGFMVWPPLKVEASGCVVICGGSDGMIRVIVVALAKREAAGETGVDREFVRLVQTTKPHTMKITYMVLDEPFKILITGSEDATIFVYQVVKRSDYMSLNPIGFVRLDSEITHISCKQSRKATALVSCRGGDVVEMEVPEIPELYTKVSYELQNVQKRHIVFVSVKSQIRRDIFLEELAKKKEAKVEMKKEKLKQMRKDNPHLKVDEDLYLEDSESEISLESLYFPPVPNSILFSKYLAEDIIWMSPAGYDSGYIYEYKFGIEEPFKATMVEDADDIEIHSFLQDDDMKFIYLGMQNGKIRVCPIKTTGKMKEKDYWELSVHDNDNGIIPQMCFSFDRKYLFSCGKDGNLFAFTVTSEINNPDPDIPPPQIPPWPKDELEDIDDEETYSLEQLKDKAEYDRKMKLANEHKEGVLEELQVLKDKFAKLIQKNEELPIKIKIPDGDFIIDHRIEDDLDSDLQDILDLEKRKIAFDAEKSGLLLEKIESYFYNCLESQVLYVHAIRNPKLRAYTFRHRSLPNEYHAAKHFMEKKLKEGKSGDSQISRKAARSVSTLETSRPLPLGTWLRGLSSVGTNVKMNLRLQRMLLKYYERKRRLEVRKEQWIQMMKSKPDPNVSHPGDLAAMDHAEKTIGDYKLKTDPEYSTSGEKRVTMDKKFQQILATRKQIFDMQKDYGMRIYDLRAAKEALLEHTSDLRKQLRMRHMELPEEEIKQAPEFPEFPWKKEYPEDELRLKEEDILAEYPKIIQAREKTGDDSDDDQMGDFFESDDTASHTSPEVKESIAQSMTIDGGVPIDSDYEILLSDGNDIPTLDMEMKGFALRSESLLVFEEFFSVDQFLSDVNPEYLADLHLSDSQDTIWEQEMRYRRLCRSLYTQDEIIRDINDSVDEYDKRILEAKNLRFQVAVDVKFGELRLIKLHQEIIILKDFEAHEDVLQAKVTKTENGIEDEQNKIADLEEDIEIRLQEIENLHVKEKQLLAVFNETIEDNNYADFLRKVYKKKYKPPKEKKGEDESSSESSLSSTSSSEDDESYDSQDLDIIKLDESICPPDLDRDIYDMTFKLRGERHKVEIQEAEEKKMIEINKKEIENIHKKIKNLERELQTQKEELKEFQREKQRRLNEVMCTVALKASQLQFFDEAGASLFNIQNKLVFSNHVLDDLTKRVGELHKETTQQKKKLVRYKKHYSRMCIDCKEMIKIINNLKVDIDDLLIKKFGCLLKVDELEDIILQRLIQEMKSPLQELTEEFYRVAEVLKNEIRKKQNELTVLFVHNTEKMNVLAILEREKDLLKITLRKETMLKKRVTYKDLFKSSAELKRLFRIVRNQGGRVLMLKAEIRAFTYKDKPPPSPICSPSKYAMELKQALWDESPCREIESVSSEEEVDETLFMYMEEQRAMDLVAERESLEKEETMPLPQEILDELMRRVPPPSAAGSEAEGDAKVEELLDSVIHDLLNKIPPTDAATSIFDEVLELLLSRLDANKDNAKLKAVLWDIVVDMRSLQATPDEVREIFQMIFKNMKERETKVSGVLEARAILYDIIRKCLGCVLGKRFQVATEEALIKVLGAMSDDEKHDLLDEIIRTLEETVNSSDNLFVKDVLEEVIHDMESLGAHDTLEQICRLVCDRLRERAGPERAMVQARHAFHEAIKKAMGIVTETENPLWERESFDADKAVVMLLHKLHRSTDTRPLYDEMCMQLEWRDLTHDTPGMQNLMEIVAKEACDEPAPNLDAMYKRINKLLRQMRHATDDKQDLACAYAALYDAVRRSIVYNYPETPVDTIHRSLEGGAAVLGLLDKLPSREDYSGLLHEIIERSAYALKMLLMSDGVQQLVSDIREALENAKEKSSNLKNVCAKIFEKQKARDFKRKDIITTFRLLYDIFRYALEDVYPDINLEDDPDIMKAVQSVLHISNLIEPRYNKVVIKALMQEMSDWVPKRTDPDQVTEKVAIVVENLIQLPQGSVRLRNTLSHIFKLIHYYNTTKALSLRVIGILRYNLKAAVRSTVPNVKLDEDICHFNPDDTLLAMMAKVPISLYTTRLCGNIRSEMKRMVETSEKITPDIRKLFEYVDEYLEQVTEGEPDIYGAMEDTLEEVKDLDIIPLENVYGRIYLNYIVRRAMSTTVPRVDIKEAACSIDKERPTLLLLHKVPRSDTGSIQLWDEFLEELQTRYETVEDQPQVSLMIRNAVLEMTFAQPVTPDHAIHIFQTCYAALREEKVALLEMLTGKNIFYEAIKESMERCFPLLDLDDSIMIDKELPIIQMLAQLPIRPQYRTLVDAIISELVVEEKEMGDVAEKNLVTEFVDELRQGPAVTGDLAHVYPCYAKIRDMEWPVKVFKDFKEVVYSCIKRGILNVFPNLALQDNQTAWETEESLLISSLALPQTDDPSPLIDEVRERLGDVRSTMLVTENVKRLVQEIEHHLSVMPIEPGNYEYIVTCMLSVLNERSGRHLDIARIRTIMYDILRDAIHMIAERFNTRGQIQSRDPAIPEDFD